MKTYDNKPLPDLNVDMLFDLIRWAEVSEGVLDEAIDDASRFARWGRWGQGAWAIFSNRTNAPLSLTGLTKMSEDDKRATLNGVCETAYCMAGQAVTQAGYRIMLPHQRQIMGGDAVSANLCIKQEPTDKVDLKGRRIMRDSGSSTSISFAAMNVLGLCQTEADALFAGHNTIPVLRVQANRFCEARGYPLMFPDDGLAHADAFGVYYDNGEGYFS